MSCLRGKMLAITVKADSVGDTEIESPGQTGSQRRALAGRSGEINDRGTGGTGYGGGVVRGAIIHHNHPIDHAAGFPHDSSDRFGFVVTRNDGGEFQSGAIMRRWCLVGSN